MITKITNDEEFEDAQKTAEIGRLNQVALDRLRDYLKARKEMIINSFETGECKGNDITDKLAELRVMRDFEDKCNTRIAYGKMAERELSRYGKQ